MNDYQRLQIAAHLVLVLWLAALFFFAAATVLLKSKLKELDAFREQFLGWSRPRGVSDQGETVLDLQAQLVRASVTARDARDSSARRAKLQEMRGLIDLIESASGPSPAE